MPSIEALTEAFIYYPVERYDISGKQILKQNVKYYVVDLGLRRYLLPKREYDLGYSLENLVYLDRYGTSDYARQILCYIF